MRSAFGRAKVYSILKNTHAPGQIVISVFKMNLASVFTLRGIWFQNYTQIQFGQGEAYFECRPVQASNGSGGGICEQPRVQQHDPAEPVEPEEHH